MGGRGFNSGVLMLDLDGMRRSAIYASLLRGYSQKGQSALPMPAKKRKLGWMADQTLFSLMSTPKAGGASLFFELPCGWNRQTSTSHSMRPGNFAKWHACESACHVVHGNEWESKKVVSSLHQDPSGRSCRRVVHDYRCSLMPFRDPRSQASIMWDLVANNCCT